MTTGGRDAEILLRVSIVSTALNCDHHRDNGIVTMPLNEAEIEAREIEAFLISVSRSVVGIVGRQHGEFGKGIGTGTLIQLEEKPHVLTAAHVIQDCLPEELMFFMPSSIELQDRARGQLPRLRPTEVFAREPLIVKSARMDARLDVAVIELSDIYCDYPNLTFRDIVPVPKPPPPGSDTVMMGFPARHAQRFGVGFMVFRFVEYPRVEDPGNRLFKDFDPNAHFLLDYPGSEDYDPAGFSGSALWGRKEETGLWQPNPRLLGMVLSYYRGPSLLQAISAQRIAAFLGV